MRIAVAVSLIMVVIIAILLNATSPTAIGPLGVLVFFLCLYIFFMCFFFVLATIAKSLACRLLNGAKVVRLVHFSDRKLYYYATVVALSPAIYVGMQSVGGAGVFEIVLLFVFEILACFFVHKKY